MDLGIAGRRAIVCASSRGLGRACAEALAWAATLVIVFLCLAIVLYIVAPPAAR